MFAAHRNLDNLVAVVDRNCLQIDGDTADVCDPGDLAAKFQAFGWDAREVDGHDMAALVEALAAAKADRAGKPHALIARTGEFTINLTTAAMARAVDWCGVRSGRDYDKFRETGLTPLRGAVVAAPALEESPVVVECRVRQILPLGSHDMFLAEVVNVLVDDRYIDSATGRFDLERAGLVAYSHGEYFRLGELIGHFGWSVRRRKIIVRERKGRR